MNSTEFLYPYLAGTEESCTVQCDQCFGAVLCVCVDVDVLPGYLCAVQFAAIQNECGE